MRVWLTVSKALDWSKEKVQFNLPFSKLSRIFSASTSQPCSSCRTMPCRYCMSHGVLAQGCVQVIVLLQRERVSMSLKNRKWVPDCLSGTRAWIKRTISLLGTSMLDQPTEWTSPFLAICRFKRFLRMSFRVTVCFMDQYYVLYALQGLHFCSLSQYSYQLLSEISR